MIHRISFAVAVLAALLAGAGCSDRGAPLIPETDEAYYAQGVQLNRQGRKGEALTSFLRVIDKRGERGAPESHLEVAALYLNHTKEPVLAYYHFKRYLELQPNSKEAPRVRAMLDAALREVAARFPGRPLEDQSVRLAATEEITKLRKENDELRAELQTLRGGGAAMANRAQRMVSLPDAANSRVNTPPPTVAITDGQIVPAPSQSVAQPPAHQLPAAQQPAARTAGMPTPFPNGPQKQATQRPTPTQPQAQAQAPTPMRPAAGSGRTHTVRPKETLYAISRQYGVKLEDLARANGISNPSSVPVGTVLRIP